MAIEAIGGITSTTPTTANQASVVNQNDLIKIMLTELQYQDPLKPLDNTEFIAQLAQFTNLEQTSQLNDRMDTLLSVQAATQSVGLLGRTVQVTLPDGSSDSGSVMSITFSNGEAQLTVKNDSGALLTNIGLASVTLVR
jgi:flagellar basal-body rod modification protein FlgD